MEQRASHKNHAQNQQTQYVRAIHFSRFKKPTANNRNNAHFLRTNLNFSSKAIKCNSYSLTVT